MIVANNLASLITTYRDDAESLERAWSIARRLRGSDVPAFQDTYGWIALRRGDIEDALAPLEPAAASLSNDPLVQFHLAVAYAEAGRKGDPPIVRFFNKEYPLKAHVVKLGGFSAHAGQTELLRGLAGFTDKVI